MEEGKKHIDDLFREGLGKYQEVPDANIWAALESQLPAASPSAPGSGAEGSAGTGGGAAATGGTGIGGSAGMMMAGKWLVYILLPLAGSLVTYVAMKTTHRNPAESAYRQQQIPTAVQPDTASGITAIYQDSISDKHTQAAPEPIQEDLLAKREVSASSKAINTGLNKAERKKDDIEESTIVKDKAEQSAKPLNNDNNRIPTGNTKAAEELANKSIPEQMPESASAKVPDTEASNEGSTSEPGTGKEPSIGTEQESIVAENSVPPAYRELVPLILPAYIFEATGRVHKNSRYMDMTTRRLMAGGDTSQKLVSVAAKERRPSKLDMEGGIKAGYEVGFGKDAVHKPIAALYLQYNISDKISVAIQPTVKSVKIAGRTLSPRTTYYDNLSYSLDSGHIYIAPAPFDTLDEGSISRNYFYSQQYDTIVITNQLEALKYLEIDLPVLLRYRIKGFGIYAGPVISFVRTAQIREMRNSYKVSQSDTLFYPTASIKAPRPGIPKADGLYTPPLVKHISMYDGSPYQNAATEPLRFGYMAGFSYTFYERVMLEVMVQQMLSGNKQIPNSTIRSMYTQPYLRATLGYRLFKTKKK